MATLTIHGHPQHLVVACSCLFRMATEVVGDRGSYIVSTVGEYSRPGRDGLITVGHERLYETYVFETTGGHQDCGCPVVEDFQEIEGIGANTAREASRNHHDTVNKWAAIADKGQS